MMMKMVEFLMTGRATAPQARVLRYAQFPFLSMLFFLMWLFKTFAFF